MQEQSTTTITRRCATGTIFPEAIMQEWNPHFATREIEPDGRDEITDANMRRHNAALRRHVEGTPRPLPTDTHHTEWRILALIEGATLTARALQSLRAVPAEDDYLLSEYANDLQESLTATIRSISGLLDYDTGRLQCGELSAYLGDLAETFGMQW